jgi:hypothetical protein
VGAAHAQRAFRFPANHELWTLSTDPVQLRGEARYQHLRYPEQALLAQAGLTEAQGVGEVFVAEHAELGDLDVGGRQPRQAPATTCRATRPGQARGRDWPVTR